ncbi:hypothetical protein [Streptomyces sp. NBC_00691]|uniref:hypothetical protein n=1 Tax=Streptomyces sp. NBC_00691 TaxID=2903671 RepID=UPI002E35AB89|nr:hypothetical protein [Streptomyces sp. NBC_00691]
MEGQAAAQPAGSRVPLDERVRTCRPAIVRQPQTDEATGERKPDWNIIRGED